MSAVRLGTVRNDTPDGQLVVVSADGTRHLPAGPALPNLLAAIEAWDLAAPALAALADELAAGAGLPLDHTQLAAPLPRSWQWLDGSAFGTHGELMQVAFHMPPIETDLPLMYQGVSDRFHGPNDPVPFADVAHGIDFEGEFGVIVDAVPMGTSARDAAAHIRLVVQINDWSLRTLAPIEMKTGFGWIQAKPPCSMAPFAVTPAALGQGWHEGRVALTLAVDWNGQRFGRANGARTRDLVAGTVIGSGTVSNPDYATVGSSCISERRAIEIIADGKPSTAFMGFGDRVRMAALDADGGTPFGAIDQEVVRAKPPA
jgi:fumarylacetoacetate (FAA) hydrolase